MASSPRLANTRRQPPPWWLIACAAAYVGYFVLLAWCEIDRPEPPGLIVRFDHDRMVALSVTPDSPAARAGLAAGDAILAANGHPLRSRLDWLLVAANLDTNQPIALRVVRHRDDVAAAAAAAFADETLVLPRARNRYWLGFEGLTHAAVRLAQLITLIVGLIVAFKRPRDGVAIAGAWLLATVAVFSVDLPYGMAITWRSLPAPIGWALWPPYLSTLAVAAVMWTFFAIFPKPLFQTHTRTRVLLALGWTPMLLTLAWHARFTAAMLYAPQQELAWSWWAPALLVVTALYVLATLLTLVTNYQQLTEVTERRRVRVLLLGMLTGLASGLPIVLIFWSRSGVDLTHSLFGSPLFAMGTVLLLACPASFAYAILRHRLFDAGTVIRQGVQYALARQVLLSLVPGLAVLLALDLLLHKDLSVGDVLQARGWIYGSIAAIAVLARFRRRVWLDKLDRHFFRERYDAQRLLHDVAHRSREAGDLGDVASHVVTSIERALHPTCAAILMRAPHTSSFSAVASVECAALSPLDSESTAIGLLRLLGKPIDLDPDEGGQRAQDLPDAERELLARAPIELLVPIAMHRDADARHERSEALIALGPRRSEEPYSQEDYDLLSAVADSLAMVLDRTTPTPRDTAADTQPRAMRAHAQAYTRAHAGERGDGRADRHLDELADGRECPECGACYDADVDRCAQDDVDTVALVFPRRLADRYRLDRRMARGGMGTVYEAFDQSLDRRVAAKVLRPELLHSSDAAKRFEREARLAASLTHPHIVTVHDFGVTSTGSGFLVMERLEGVTLRNRLARGLQFAPEDALRVLRGVASAVEFAHQRQLVHRDLKPENIFLVRGNDALTMDAPKVLDFGLARALAPTSATSASVISNDRLTQSGMLVGTLQYMPPEQLRGEEATAAWDLWALALIAYEMLTGTLPFSGHLGAAAAGGHEAAIAASLDGALAGARETFVRALALDAASRYPSASAFVDALQDVTPASAIDSKP
jgi:tRNA A-37 threonylcarbamoyl transferase component Bud32